MHNMKPISKDATDDQCHFQIQQLAKFYFYHSWPELQQKETGSSLQMGKEKKLSMAAKITKMLISYVKHRLMKSINLSWSKLCSPVQQTGKVHKLLLAFQPLKESTHLLEEIHLVSVSKQTKHHWHYIMD